VFLERGYERATIKAIADTAQVSAGTVLNAAPSKAALLAEILKEEYAAIGDSAERLATALSGRLSDRLLALCVPAPVRVEHVGRTAVLGLAAKPIVDMMLGVRRLADVERRIPVLEADGWEYVPEHERIFPDRRFFARPVPRPRTHHLHAVEVGTDFWRDHLAFRDHLRTHPADADIGSIFGWGFPAWTGGTLSFIETVGVEHFVREADRLTEAYGDRFAVPESLRTMAKEGRTFYAGAEPAAGRNAA